MARISKNFLLNGKIGHFVFTTQGDKTYVRSLPKKVKQTKNTKAAAKQFGLCSEKDKNYRLILNHQYTLYNDSRYAARHRAQLLKTIIETPNAHQNHLVFTTPQPLLHFCFNQQLIWDKVIRFYPNFKLTSQNLFSIDIPEIHWGQDVRPQKKTNNINITFHAFVVNLNQAPIILEKVADIECPIQKNQTLPAQFYTYSIAQNVGWLLVLATVVLENKENGKPATFVGTSTYIFVANCSI